MLFLVVGLVCAAGALQWRDSAPDTSTALIPARYELDIRVDLAQKRIDGDARLIAVNTRGTSVRTTSVLLYRLMRVTSVHDDGGAPMVFSDRVIEFLDHPTFQVRQIVITLPKPLAPGDSIVLRIAWGGYLVGYGETGWSYLHDQIDSTYSLLRMDTYAYPELRPPSHVLARRQGLPRYDYHARITVPAGYTVANGGEVLSQRDSAGWTTFEFRNLKPAWRMDFAVAPFLIQRQGALRVYALPADSIGGTRVMQSMQRGMQLFTRWFGPLRNQHPFALIELPDGWGSQADVTSILQTAAAFRDSMHAREIYHELSHLWNVPPTESAPPRWEEGLASFVEDLAVDSLHGRATIDKNAQWLVGRLRERIPQDRRLSEVASRDYGRNGVTDFSYSVGGLMFYIMYRVMGHDSFTRLIREYYASYAMTGANLDQFMTMAKRLSPLPLDALFTDWVQSTRWTTIVATTDAAGLVRRYAAGSAKE